MKSEEIRKLFKLFEEVATEFEGVECWSARELQKLLGYTKWENFQKVIDKAKESCKKAGDEIIYHFPEVRKTIPMPKGAEKDIIDILLTRYSCYLIAQNGDSSKEPIAFAQNYFAVQTRRAEIIEQRFLDYERVRERGKLAESERVLSGLIYQRGVDDKGFGLIRSKGEKALFTMDTATYKKKLSVPDGRPLADFLPTVSIKAKEFASTLTTFNVQSKDLHGLQPIEKEHVENNLAVRNMLNERGITPENLPPAEDIKKIERKLNNDEKKALITKIK